MIFNWQNLINKLSQKPNKTFVIWAILVLVLVFLLLFYYFFLSAPSTFPINQIITIEKGTSFKKVAADFEEQGIIRSAFWFDTFGWILRSREDVKAGEYFFEESISAMKLFLEVTKNGGRSNLVRVTIPEGASIDEIVMIFEGFGFKGFKIENKEELEGYLFPDTYFVPTNISAESMIEIMRENFDKKTTTEMREHDIVTMASLIEKEASKEKDRKLISGILWKRIDVGMPLQVDVVFPYIINKYSLQLTNEDLRVDSPYNTYTNKGLPPGPIANPGLNSLEAALNPTESDYWFYLSDRQGNMHYSATYEQHLEKRKIYLGK